MPEKRNKKVRNLSPGYLVLLKDIPHFLFVFQTRPAGQLKLLSPLRLGGFYYLISLKSLSHFVD